MNIQQHQNMRDNKEVKESNQESEASSTPPSPSSNSSSPSHEFSFTISFQQTKQIPHPPSSSSSSSSFAIDLSPADDIFFHGHLLPLHLLSHFPISSPRSSTNSLDSFTLPKKDHFLEHHKVQNFKNQRVLLDEDMSGECRMYADFTSTLGAERLFPVDPRLDEDISYTSKGKPKAKSFSLFGIPKWRNGYDQVKNQKENKKKMKFDVMTQVVKRYIRMVRPFLSFRNKKNMQFHRQSYSFSGNLLSSRGIKGQYSSAPASIRTSPTNSGLLVEKSTGERLFPIDYRHNIRGANYNNSTNSSSCSSSDSTMEELQGAIQAAIAHCKKSISMEDKIKLP